MIKKIVSILLIFIALVALIGGMTIAALRIFFPDEKVREMLVNSGRWYLQRDVALERLSLGFFSGIELGGLSVSEKPDFRAGTFVSVGGAHLRVHLLPLLRHDVRVSEIRVTNPAVRIARGKNGDLNFEDLKVIYGSPEKTGDILRVAVPLPFLIGDTEITGGSLVYTDASLRNLRVELREISVAARNVSPLSPFEARVAFVIAGKKTPVSARLSVDIPRDRIDIIEGTMGSGDRTLRVSGFLENVAGDGDMKFSLDVEGDVAVLNELCGILPLETDLTIFPLPRVHAQISGTPAALSLRFLP